MKQKHIFGGVMVVVFLSLMIYLFTQTNLQYESDFSKVKSKERMIKATGSWVKEKGHETDQNKNFVFTMKDVSGNEMKVVYDGAIPNNFEVATSVVVTGMYRDGYFHAKNILTKCPSKYQDVKDPKSASM
ncbi:MAG: cytochrome C biogenesis protein [Chlorobiaceae bacterium]|nr:cytochrome C biogenesis protein [Chlorobiaceae bacterium]